jgi:PIN domain nuclease of toxin-antitoxin system
MTLLLDTHAFLWFCQGDPLVAQALADNLAIVSVDPSHELYGVTRLW